MKLLILKLLLVVSQLPTFQECTTDTFCSTLVSTSTVMQTVHSLVSGATQVKEELETLLGLGSLPPGDLFVGVMQVSCLLSLSQTK